MDGQIRCILGAIAVFALLSLASQPVRAHAGHAHGVSASQSAPLDTLQTDAGSARKLAIQEMSEGSPGVPSANDGCGNPGCCSNGNCCHSVLTVTALSTAPPTLTTMTRLTDTPPPFGAGAGRLRRPPKSFV